MSNFIAAAYHPLTNTVRAAAFMDDYFGHYIYGIKFEGDDKVYRTEEITIPTDKIFVELFDPGYSVGYLDALKDFEELLDNAVSNHSGPTECQHWDHELRDQINMLRENVEETDGR